MSPFRSGEHPGYKMRVSHAGRAKVCGCDTTNRATAEAIAGWVGQLKQGHRWEVIDAIIDGRVKLAKVYDRRFSLGTFMAEVARAEQAARAAEQDTDISPLVSEWAKDANPKYVRQVRALVPESQRFPKSQFTREWVRMTLRDLAVSGTTWRKYKAALSAFAWWLIDGQHIPDDNPALGLGKRPWLKLNPARTTWLPPKDGKALVLALSGEARFVAAIMALTGVEWGALAAARCRDLDLEARTLFARGSKTKWRVRTVEILDHPDWTPWAWPIIESHARTLTEAAPLVTITEWDALREQTEACATLGLPKHTLHDWRHTLAVNWLKRGDDHQALKRQLAHAPNSMMIYNTYGVYIEEARRLEERARRTGVGRKRARPASSSASSRETPREVRRAKS